LVKEIQVSEGQVRVEVELPEDHQFAANIREEIMEKIEPLWDVEQVIVEFIE
jgi:nitrogen fixation NifU-like protein